MKIELKIIKKIINAIILAIGATFYIASLLFIIEQPTSILRGIKLYLLLYSYISIIASFSVFLFSFITIKRVSKYWFIFSIIFLLLGIVFWSYINTPPLSELFLPEIKGK